MKRDPIQPGLISELADEDQEQIREIFYDRVAPKLAKLDARTGTISCEFAGQAYRHWTIRFESAGSGFNIVEFEYDEDAVTIDLDL